MEKPYTLILLLCLTLPLSLTLTLTPNLLISWFHGDITGENANASLSNKEHGTFLIRLSSTDPLNKPFTLSCNNRNVHITRTTQGFVFQNEVYQSLDGLVQKHNSTLIPCPKKCKLDYVVDLQHI
jgi:SH2 domain